ncbi:MAG: hypothetical protein HQM12_22055 [SAR324 cluster bacterium]|nr:hypothetical protein [SAR324 cluster bacterium]
MNYNEYLSYAAEITQLESLLAEIPVEDVIERLGLESRLKSARDAIEGINEQNLNFKAKLTFRGKPVLGSHGIAADFASKATGIFADAVSAVAAGLAASLRDTRGPIPDKQKNQLLITGTTIGSFGFEFELPQPKEGMLLPESSNAENSLQKIQELFQLSAEGSDDQMAELVDEIHPRAVKKVADFMNYIVQQEAWCGFEFKNRFFKFKGLEQLRNSASRLREENIQESAEEFTGKFIGILPESRAFEFQCMDQKMVLKGKIGPEISDANILNQNYLQKSVKVKLHVIRVGQGHPRYSLLSLDAIHNMEE